MAWGPEQQVQWHIDLLLAHRVVQPVLARYRQSISLWRFHRRAARDGAGHQFSFIFYAPADTARAVFQELRSDHLIGRLKTFGQLVKDSYQDPGGPLRSELGATSDRRWSALVRETWPYYIMGVSEMWLNQINHAVAELSQGHHPPDNLENTLDLYRQTEKMIQAAWQEEGRHAYLHHLNALYGYEPLVVHERRLMNF
jgi:hypothetical protein